MPRSLVIVFASIAFLLTGCEAAPVLPSPTPPPIFESETEAADAAEQVMHEFAAAATRMGQSGGEDFSGYEGIVSDAQLEDEESDAANLKGDGKHLVGELILTGFTVRTFVEDDAGVRLAAHTCLDTTAGHYVDSNGVDLSVEGHITAVPEVIEFVATFENPTFVVDGIERWTGRDFCVSG